MSTTAPRDPRLQVDAEGIAGLWSRFTRRVKEGELGSLPVIVGLIIIWLFFSFKEENFLTSGNITNLMLQVTGFGIIATGIVLVLLLGEIDLSVGIVSGLAASVMAVLNVQHGWSGWAAIVAGLAVGLACGLVQGFFITYFRVPSFVVTLAGLLAFQGALLWVLGSTGTVNITDTTITDLANTFFSPAVGWIIALVVLVPYVLLTLFGYRRRIASGLDIVPFVLILIRLVVVCGGVIIGVAVLNSDRGVPLATLIFVGVVIGVDFLTRRTAFGRHVYAVGGNAEAARPRASRCSASAWSSSRCAPPSRRSGASCSPPACSRSIGAREEATCSSTRSQPRSSVARASSVAGAPPGRRCWARW